MSDEAGEHQRALDTAARALRLVCISLPHLSGLAHLVQVVPDERVGTAGVFPSGRLLINPAWFLELKPRDATFVMAHELLHLALRTHQRASGHDADRFNVAHDYIINDILEAELGMPPPGGGLRMVGARFSSAESLLASLGDEDPRRAFEQQEHTSALGAALRDALRKQGATGSGSASGGALHTGHGDDVLSADLERQWFPDLPAIELEAAAEQVERAAEQAVSLEQIQERAREAARDVRLAVTGQQGGYGYADPSTAYVDALRSMYRPPWELALQRWLEAATPNERTYARPSRRGADRADVVLPGRAHTGWTLSIVLDTSGSMADELAPALGAIASFCEGVGVEQVRILQCDTAVERDELIDVDRLARFAISGFGGSNLSPALERLADDPEVEAAVVLTDGAIFYPRSPMPYLVLWVLTSKNDGFRPPYGQVIELQA